MRTAGTFFGALATALLLSAAAIGQEKEEAPAAPPTPDQVTSGEIRITMSSDYAKVLVDGEPWEETEFLNNGLLLVVHTVNRTVEHKILLTPIYSDLGVVEVVVKPDDWKLATIAKNEKMWRVERKVAFPKAAAKPAPKAEPKPAAEPAAPTPQ